MRLLRLLVAALVLLSSSLLSSSAAAQAPLTIGPNYIWSTEGSRDGRLSTEINTEDCLADATIRFQATIPSNQGAFEVWVGTACSELENRTDGQCFKVADAATETQPITLRVQDLLQEPSASAGEGTGTAEVCSGEEAQSGGIALNVFFMLIDAGKEDTPIANVPLVFKYDITAPAPPTNIEVGPGENSLVLSFTASIADDLEGYRFYCSEVGPAPAQGAGGAGEEAPPADSDCTSSTLVPGELPPADAVQCGDASGGQVTEGTASGDLANGTRYVVAVGARDKFDNVGALSVLTCGTPQEVTGFFEAYRAAGGQGGGGFCSFGPARRGVLGIAVGLLLAGALLVRRRK